MMFSFIVERLQGRRDDCHLDDYVKNVRAKAEKQLEAPEGKVLRRILSIDSDPSQSPVEGAYVELFPGYDQAILQSNEQVCYEWFVQPARSNIVDGLTFGVLVQDEIYQASIAEIENNLSMLRLLLPVLIVLCGGIGFFAGFLATRGRTKEFAVMRCIGMSQTKIFGLVMGELVFLTLTGTALGVAGGTLLEGRLQTEALWNAAIIAGVFLVGSGIAAVTITSVNVMKLMKVED